jgi:heme-degrading monooxygenase HmoA
MDRYFWVSTRRIKPDTREQFEQSWRPAEFPDGLVGAYVLYAEEGDEVVGISIWDSAEACDRYRRSEVEARRREAMGLRGRGAVELLHRPRARNPGQLTRASHAPTGARGWEGERVAVAAERARTRRS